MATAAEAEVASAFQQAYGVSLDDEWQRAQNEDADEKGVPLWERTEDPLALGGGAADLSERCDGRGSFATFELGQESSLAWYDDVLSSGFNVASCDPDSALHVEQIGWTGELETAALSLPAGRYYVAPTTGVGTLGLRIAANAIAASCGDAAPIVLPSGQSDRAGRDGGDRRGLFRLFGRVRTLRQFRGDDDLRGANPSAHRPRGAGGRDRGPIRLPVKMGARRRGHSHWQGAFES